MRIPFLLAKLAAGLALAGAAAVALAQDNWPQRPVKIIVPFAPGGGGDAVVRNISEKLGERLGQAVVIENRPGASGYIGAQAVAAAAPDGYTLLMGFDGSLVVAPHLIKAPFDAQVDFAPITKLNDATLILAAHQSVPAKNLAELVEYSKKQGGLGFGSSGAATTTHLAGELLAIRSGAQLRHVPYKGGGQAVTDLVAGHVQTGFVNVLEALPHVNGGRLRALAVSTPARSAVMPTIPTVVESGVAGFEVTQWSGVLGPARLPAAIVAKLNGEIGRVLARPDMRERLLASGADPGGGPPERLAALITADIARWSKVVRALKLNAS